MVQGCGILHKTLREYEMSLIPVIKSCDAAASLANVLLSRGRSLCAVAVSRPRRAQSDADLAFDLMHCCRLHSLYTVHRTSVEQGVQRNSESICVS